jgi:hypothetical protein
MENEIAIDARPAFPTSQDSLWDAAAMERDNITSIIDSELKTKNITAWIRKSKPGEYPLYVVIESWIRNEETDRSVVLNKSFLKLIILVDPCREHSFIYKIELERNGKKYSGEHWNLSDNMLRELVFYLINGGKKPKFFRPRFSIIKRIVITLMPFFGNPMKNKLIREARPNYWTIPFLLGWSGIFIVTIWLLFGVDYPSTSMGNLALWIALGPLIAAVIMSERREIIEVVPKQSLRTPRREFRIDSWHVSVPGAGEQFEQFKQRLLNIIKVKESSIEMGVELHQRLTPRGYEERERLVLIKGQTTLHVHIYPFANDAFVGWESYLNWNRWVETAPISTTVKDGKKLNYRSLNVGVYLPTDFDLIEADVLAETTHRIIVEEIKAFLKEKEIEADLDFKIIRGDRANALKEGKDEKDKNKGW